MTPSYYVALGFFAGLVAGLGLARAIRWGAARLNEAKRHAPVRDAVRAGKRRRAQDTKSGPRVVQHYHIEASRDPRQVQQLEADLRRLIERKRAAWADGSQFGGLS